MERIGKHYANFSKIVQGTIAIRYFVAYSALNTTSGMSILQTSNTTVYLDI